MDGIQSFSRLILNPDEQCPHRNNCPFNARPESCYGSLKRDNEFICNLDELRLQYNREDKNKNKNRNSI